MYFIFFIWNKMQEKDESLSIWMQLSCLAGKVCRVWII